MTADERRLLIAVTRVVLTLAAPRHLDHDGDLADLLDQVTAPPEPEKPDD